MHPVELVELAGLVASHARFFLHLTEELPERELERYWTASKCRLDRWQLALFELKDGRSPLVGPTGMLHRAAWAMIEEIFSGEMLTRVWGGALWAFDQHRGSQQAEPVARSVLAGHQEVRCRTMTLLSTTRDLPLGGLVEFNRLRRLCERWTDLLLAEIAPWADVSDMAHEPERMRDFAADVPRQTNGAFFHTRRSLIQSSLRAAFERHAASPAPNADLNRRIAAGVLGCFQPELFDGAGVLRSAWMTRLMTTADDAEMMLADYLAPATTVASNGTGRRGLRRL